MLRVIAGKYRSRKLHDVLNSHTRPTTDKNKEVLFNTIGQFFEGGRMLDLFSGSGSLGIEALSRGVDYADFVDNDLSAIKTIKLNLKNLEITEKEYAIHCKDSLFFLNSTDKQYDLIIADPPYKLDFYEDILKLISSRQLINNNGIIVLESESKRVMLEKFNSLVLFKVKTMGNTKLSFYRKEE
jgi:16S rRNA (guanine(966)-N(2))-methyltransferase RsmD